MTDPESYDTRSSSPGEYGYVRVCAGTLTYDNADGYIDIDTLSVGDTILMLWMEITATFDAGTSNDMSVGNDVTPDAYVTSPLEALDGIEPATVTLTPSPRPSVRTVAPLRVSYIYTGTPPTAGETRVYAMISSAAL